MSLLLCRWRTSDTHEHWFCPLESIPISLSDKVHCCCGCFFISTLRSWEVNLTVSARFYCSGLAIFTSP